MLKHKLVLPSIRILLVLAAALGSAGCSSIMASIANAPAVFGDYEVRRNIRYAQGPARKLDVYLPSGAAAPRPVVVFIHGGGWNSGSKSSYRFVGEALSAQGYVVVIPDYRLYPQVRFPGFIEDAAQAIAWTRTHSAEIGGDPAKVFLMGHSAGAHIAAMLTYDERFLRAAGVQPADIAGFIGLAGAYDFLPFRWKYLADVFAPPENYPHSQPVNYVDGAEPRALLLHGLADTVVDPSNTMQLAATVRTHGGEVREQYYDGMSHSGPLSAMSVYFRKKSEVLQEIGRFIESPDTGNKQTAQSHRLN
jgi:acetyl esterase/lipase